MTTTSVADLGWLAGTWHGIGVDAVEHWLDPRGGSMVGVNHTVADGATASVETMLMSDTDGAGPDLTIVLPRTGRQMAMVHVASGDTEIEWVDPDDEAHRLSYRIAGDQLIVVLTRGDRRIEMTFARA